MNDITIKKTETKAEETPLKEGVSLNTIKSKGGEIEKMFKSGVHYGYSKRTRHPKTKPYIYGVKNEIQIFDLEKVKESLEEACNFVKNLGKEKRIIFFVGTKPAAKALIEEKANSIQMPFCIERWLGGILTNFSSIKKRLDYFDSLKKKKDTEEWNKYTKKERLDFEKKEIKMKRFFGGFEKLQKLPDALIIIDPKDEKIAFKEAIQLGIPTVALLGSDNDPSKVSYPVVANDTSQASIKYFLERITNAYQEGLELEEKKVPILPEGQNRSRSEDRGLSIKSEESTISQEEIGKEKTSASI